MSTSTESQIPIVTPLVLPPNSWLGLEEIWLTSLQAVSFYGTKQDIHPQSGAIIDKVLAQTDSSAPLRVGAVVIAGLPNDVRLIGEVAKLHLRSDGILGKVTVRHYCQEGVVPFEFDIGPQDVNLMSIDSPCKITAKGKAVYPTLKPVKDKAVAEEEQEEHEAMMKELKTAVRRPTNPAMLAHGMSMVIDTLTVLYETATDPTAKDRIYGSDMPQDKQLCQLLEQILVYLKRPIFAPADQEVARFQWKRLANHMNNNKLSKRSKSRLDVPKTWPLVNPSTLTSSITGASAPPVGPPTTMPQTATAPKAKAKATTKGKTKRSPEVIKPDDSSSESEAEQASKPSAPKGAGAKRTKLSDDAEYVPLGGKPTMPHAADLAFISEQEFHENDGALCLYCGRPMLDEEVDADLDECAICNGDAEW